MLSLQIDRAGRHQKVFVDQVHQPVRQAGREVRAEIDRAVLVQPPRHVHARILLERRVANVGIGLVVAQQNVEFRLVLLDQFVFERQRFFLVVDDDVFEVGRLAHQRAGLRVLPARFQKVRAHAAAQRARLPHVDDRFSRILEQVHPRLGGQTGDFFAEFHSRSATIARLRSAAESRPAGTFQ